MKRLRVVWVPLRADVVQLLILLGIVASLIAPLVYVVASAR